MLPTWECGPSADQLLVPEHEWQILACYDWRAELQGNQLAQRMPLMSCLSRAEHQGRLRKNKADKRDARGKTCSNHTSVVQHKMLKSRFINMSFYCPTHGRATFSFANLTKVLMSTTMQHYTPSAIWRLERWRRQERLAVLNRSLDHCTCPHMALGL